MFAYAGMFRPPLEGKAMANSHLSAIEVEIIRSTFLSEVRENKATESQWRELATQLIQTYTGRKEVHPTMLEWIIRK